MEEQVETLAALFPDYKLEDIRSALSKYPGNPDAAVEFLLSSQNVVVKEPPQNTANAEMSQEEADLLFAKKLQEELRIEGSGFNEPDELVAKSLLMEEDEMLARQLEQESRGFRSTTNYSPRLSQQNSSISMEQVDEDVANELLNQLKSTIIPFIKNQMQGFKAPDIEEQTDTGKFGEVSFSVRDIAISDVQISEDNVSMKMEGASIQLEIKGISATLNQFTWHYEKKTGFPKLKDSGKGNAGISGTKVLVNMAFGFSQIGPSLTVNSCLVTIDKLDLKTSGTVMSLLYNLILVALKSTIKSTIEKALAGVVTDAFNNSQQMLADFE